MQPIKGSIFSFLATLFTEKGVRAILVGGYAMNAYRLQRMTFDIDFLICEKDLEKIEPVLISIGYTVFNRTNAFVQFKSNQQGLRDIDLLLSDDATVDGILAEGKTVQFAQSTFTVPSAMHLIAMKLHAIRGNSQRRLKDVPDIMHLMKSCKINPLHDSVRRLFEKYNAMVLYSEIAKDNV